METPHDPTENPAVLFLASQSPRRVALLQQFGIPFDVVKQDAEELTPEGQPWLSASELALINAGLKARSARQQQARGWILTADTVVALEDKIFGKPRDLQEAAKFLKTLSGRVHQVVTGMVLLSPENRQHGSAEVTDVRFRPLTSAVIDRYLEEVPVLDKAGAYSFEQGQRVVEAICGSATNVIGLPMERLEQLLEHAGLLRHCA